MVKIESKLVWTIKCILMIIFVFIGARCGALTRLDVMHVPQRSPRPWYSIAGQVKRATLHALAECMHVVVFEAPRSVHLTMYPVSFTDTTANYTDAQCAELAAGCLPPTVSAGAL